MEPKSLSIFHRKCDNIVYFCTSFLYTLDTLTHKLLDIDKIKINVDLKLGIKELIIASYNLTSTECHLNGHFSDISYEAQVNLLSTKL